MPTVFTTTNCPLPQVFSGMIKIADNAISTAPPNLVHAKAVNQGTTTSLPAYLNENFMRQDLLARHGGGAFAVCDGLAVSAGAGLLASVSIGKIQLDGFVEKSTVSSVVVSASQTNWIWLLSTGAFEVKTTTANPSSAGVLLGAAITSVGAVTSVDTSGVVTLVGGIPERTTADVGIPVDAPPASWRGFTITGGGRYFWDGTQHLLVGDGFGADWETIPVGTTVRVPSGMQKQVFAHFACNGRLIIDGRFRITD